MGFGKFFGFGGRNGNGSRDSRESRGSGSRGARDTQSAEADYDRELTETFGFVGEGEERDEGKEVEPVFEEVAEEEEDRTGRLAQNVLDAQADVDRAASDRRLGKEDGFALELARRGLAQARVEQASYNFDEGKGTQGQLDQAIQELERAEETLERSEEGAEVLARHRADRAAGGKIDIGGYTAGQIRGRPRRGRTETSSSA